MKRSFGTSLMLLSSGIALGGGGMYLVHVLTSANNPMQGTQISVETQASESSPGGGTQLNSESGRHVRSNNQSVDSLEDSDLHINPIQRRLVIYTYVAGLSVQELTSELEGTTNSSRNLSHRVKNELQTALIERIAIKNPEAAVKFAIAQKAPEQDWSTRWFSWQDSSEESERAHMPVVQNVFTDWAISDLNSAILKAKSLSSDAKSNALAGILSTQAGQSLSTHRRIARELGDEKRGEVFYVLSFSTEQVDDLKAAWNEIITLINPNDFRHYRALSNIASQWYEQDGFGVLDEISESTLASNVKSSMIGELLTQSAEDNPERTFEYALKMPSEGRLSSPLWGVVSTWAESDPQAALQAVNNIETRGQREQFQQNIARTWARNEPRYVLENLGHFPLNIQEHAISSAIETIARTSPKEAAELALEHSGEMRFSSLEQSVMREWLKQDIEAAIDWVYNGPVSEENRYNWARALTSNLVISDPRRAFDFAVKQQIPEDTNFKGEGLEARVIWDISYQNIELAVELLPGVREGTTKARAYTHIGDRYIEAGHSTKALNLGLKLPTEEQAKYFQSIFYSWVRIDPEGIVESIEKIPTAEIRSSLALSMVSLWASENFTEEQLEVLKQYLSDSDRHALENQ